MCLIRVGAKLQNCGPPGTEFETNDLNEMTEFIEVETDNRNVNVWSLTWFVIHAVLHCCNYQ